MILSFFLILADDAVIIIPYYHPRQRSVGAYFLTGEHIMLSASCLSDLQAGSAGSWWSHPFFARLAKKFSTFSMSEWNECGIVTADSQTTPLRNICDTGYAILLFFLLVFAGSKTEKWWVSNVNDMLQSKYEQRCLLLFIFRFYISRGWFTCQHHSQQHCVKQCL